MESYEVGSAIWNDRRICIKDSLMHAVLRLLVHTSEAPTAPKLWQPYAAEVAACNRRPPSGKPYARYR